MTTQLTQIVIEEVSLVGTPANPLARVAIVKAHQDMFEHCAECKTKDKCSEMAKCAGIAKKSDQPGDPSMTPEQIAELQKQLTAANAEKEALAKANGELSKQLTEAQTTLTEKDKVVKAKDEVIKGLETKLNPPAPEDVLKALPEPVRKMIEANEKQLAEMRKQNEEHQSQLAKMQEERETREWIAKANELKVAKADELGPVLMRMAKHQATPEDLEWLQTLLKSLKAQSTVSSIYGKRGSDVAKEAEPMSRLESVAAEIQKAMPKLTKEQAIEKALDQHPELYEEYRTQQRIA